MEKINTENTLFSRAPSPPLSSTAMPLAARMRPESLADFVGQAKLMARLPKNGGLHSMLLYGPPGCGKTSLAAILAKQAKRPFFKLSAARASVKEVRAVVEQGQRNLEEQGTNVVLFLDEIHRFTRSQQDSLLEAVETGWIVLIGATTENPSFYVNHALLSRIELYPLERLSEGDLRALLAKAQQKEQALSALSLTSEAEDMLLQAAGGDGRRLLSLLELVLQHTMQNKRPPVQVDSALVQQLMQGRMPLYDRDRDYHYDTISAFIKSVRGSDADAALLYLAAMLEGGEDPLFIARRLIILASEDVGNASPQALNIATSGFLAVERLGLPEGAIILSQVTTFLAACPKSNASYQAIQSAKKAVKGKEVEVPPHLRNAPTRVHKMQGFASGYRYPHDYEDHFAAGENYFPEAFMGSRFYIPTEQGYEERIKQHLHKLWPERR